MEKIYFAILKMSLNFLEQFASINFNGSDSVETETLTKAMSKVDLGQNKQKNIKKVEKNIEKNIKKSEQKKYRFVHGCNVIMTNGQYKGYSGFVYDYFPSMTSFLVEEKQMIFVEQYGDKKIGDEIMTRYGMGVILSKVDSLYSVLVKDEISYEIKLPRYCFARFVTFMDGCVMKMAQLLDVGGSDYEMVVMKLDYSSKYDKDMMMSKISSALQNSEDIYGEKIVKNSSECLDEFYMVCKRPLNSTDKDYFGKYGKIVCEIAEQYCVAVERLVKVNKSMISMDGNRVKVQRGVYKNMEGEFIDVKSACLNVQITAVNKFITDHLVRLSGGNFAVRKVVPSDVFFIDLELKNGNYFQVDEYYSDGYLGIERCNETLNMKKHIVKLEDVKRCMPGFIVTDVKKNELGECDKHDCEFMLDNIEEDLEERDDEDEENVDDYFEEAECVDQYVEKEGEMKETFKDVERSGFVKRVLSKDDKEYMKMIEKCGMFVSTELDSYVLLDKIVDIVKLMKMELEKISVMEWCSSDSKYIVACLVAYELIKSGYSMSIYDFRKYVTKLYNAGYLNKSSIANSGFIRYESFSGESSWKVINMSEDEKMEFKKMYKLKKFEMLVKDIMERCYKMLCVWFGNVSFTNNEKLELFPVAKPNVVREYPKYFLTTSDIINNVVAKDAKRIRWGPDSQKLVDMWKMSLSKKLKGEENNRVKRIYEFVKDNLENAPFVLSKLESSEDKMDKLKYKELKRTFDTFSSKLKIYVDKKSDEKELIIKNMSDEKERLIKKRKMYSKEVDMDSEN